MFRLTLFLALIVCAYADMQVTYSIGGSSVIFVYARNGNVTSVTWANFGANADGTGKLDSGNTDVTPYEFVPGASYAYPPEGVVHCSGVANGLAYFQVGVTAPAIAIYPLNGNDTTWSPNQSLVFSAGSITYTNA